MDRAKATLQKNLKAYFNCGDYQSFGGL